MNNDMARDTTHKIILRRKMPFSLKVVIPYTIWFAFLFLLAIQPLIKNNRIVDITYLVIPFIAWYTLVVHNAILFHFTSLETLGKVVNRNVIRHTDPEENKVNYRCSVTVEFTPENQYLEESIFLEAEVTQDTYFSMNTNDEVRVLYISRKPQLAIFGQEKFSPDIKSNKKRRSTISCLSRKFRHRSLHLFFSIIFGVAGSIAYFQGAVNLASVGVFRLIQGGFILCLGLFFLTASFYLATEGFIRHERL